MNNPLVYLLELNVILLILLLAYRLFFKKDKNFRIRRIYLLGIMLISIILPLLPDTIRLAASKIAPVAIPLEGVTIYAFTPEQLPGSGPSPWVLIKGFYLGILGLGLLRLLLQLSGIIRTIRKSERLDIKGHTVLSSQLLHASSFFGYVFMDPDTLEEQSASHILEHEDVHRHEWHSIDRILVELFVLVNWFNPAVWIYRNSVIRNLEYLADSAVIKKGTSSHQYQLSMINQYIGSASITNQFSNQIKNRINMLNKNYKLGSSWKIALIFPLVIFAFIAISCSDKDGKNAEVYKVDNPELSKVAEDDWKNSELFFVVEDMPTFEGGEPINFRKHIAKNLIYPPEAVEKGIGGKIFVKFIVTKTGKVVIPDESFVAKQEGKELDEVVVVAYRPINPDDEAPEEKYIQMLKDEVVRVVSASPAWEPGKQRGKAVNVMFTFPVTFALQ